MAGEVIQYLVTITFQKMDLGGGKVRNIGPPLKNSFAFHGDNMEFAVIAAAAAKGAAIGVTELMKNWQDRPTKNLE